MFRDIRDDLHDGDLRDGDGDHREQKNDLLGRRGSAAGRPFPGAR